MKMQCLVGNRLLKMTIFVNAKSVWRNLLDCQSCLQPIHRSIKQMSTYKLKDGIPHDLLGILHSDWSEDTIKFWRQCRRQKQFYENQKYNRQMHKELGSDLAAAYFVVSYGGSVKFWGIDCWYKMDSNKNHELPPQWMENLHLEAIDASGTKLAYPAIENFNGLKYLSYLNVSNCPEVDDWFLARAYILKDSLQYLDISGCPSITEYGLASLHHLPNLRFLNVQNLPQIEYKDITFAMVEELLPDCDVVGVGFLPRGPDLIHQKHFYERIPQLNCSTLLDDHELEEGILQNEPDHQAPLKTLEIV